MSLLGAVLPPVIVTQPVTSAIVGTTYSQQIVARDPQGQSISYSLSQYPPGMSIDRQSGLINWLPSVAGSFTVTVITEGLTQPLIVTNTRRARVQVGTTNSPIRQTSTGCNRRCVQPLKGCLGSAKKAAWSSKSSWPLWIGFPRDSAPRDRPFPRAVCRGEVL